MRSPIGKKPIPFSATAPILLASLLLLWAFYLSVALNIPYDPDAGNQMVMAKAAVDGNVLLKGWAVATQSFLTTERPFYMAGILTLGFTWKVIYVVTGLHYASIALLTIYLSTTGEAQGISFRKLLVPLCLSAYLAAFAFGTLYLSIGHLVGFAYCLVCLLCIRNIERTGHWIHYLLFAAFLALAMMGDVFGLYLVAIPVTLVCLFRIVARGPRTTTIALLLATLSSVAFSKVAWLVLASLGAARWPAPSPQFADLSSLAHRADLLFGVVFDVFSIKLTGWPVNSYEFVIGVVRLSGSLLFAFALTRVLVQFPRRDLYIQVLAAIIVINLAESLFSASATTARYVLPSLIFGIPLVSQVVFESGLFRAHARSVMWYFPILFLCLLPPLSFAKPVSIWDGIAKDLVQLRLANGYGPFWGANSMTLATSGKVTVRSVWLQDGDAIAPFLCSMSDPNWYSSYANFLVLNTDGSSDPQPSREQAVRTFGSPTGVYSLGKYGDLLVWDHNITPQLARPDRSACP